MEVSNRVRLSVLFLTIARNQASYRYRVAQFMPFWNDFGIQAEEVCVVGSSFLAKLRIALSARHFDYVILQKKLLSGLVIRLISRETRLVYDFDDALYAREPYLTGPPRSTQPGSRTTVGRLANVLRRASLVFAGNRILGQYASAFASGVHVVPTTLEAPDPVTRPQASAGETRIGWIGNAKNLFYLKHQDPVFAQLQQEYPRLRFCCMSSVPPRDMRTQWDFTPWSLAAERGWLGSMHVGIMPLTDDPWSQGKCAFKLLQYMAHGCAVVGSSVGANRDVVEDGANGFLAASEGDWHQALSRLATDHDLVGRMGQESRQRFLKEYSRARVQAQIADLLRRAAKPAEA